MALPHQTAREKHGHHRDRHQLASQYGLAEVGQQWDDEDGLEIIYEIDTRHP